MPLAFSPRPAFIYLSSSFISSATRHNHFRPWAQSPHLALPSRSSVFHTMSSSPGPPPQAQEYVTAFAAVPDEDVAQKLATSIVQNKLAACVNTFPNITSTYWWDGKVQREAEILLMMKTRASLVPELTEHVKKEHPYDVPELIVQAIAAGNPDYLTWIAASTRGPKL